MTWPAGVVFLDDLVFFVCGMYYMSVIHNNKNNHPSIFISMILKRLRDATVAQLEINYIGHRDEQT
jgi:hypothetical protein